MRVIGAGLGGDIVVIVGGGVVLPGGIWFWVLLVIVPVDCWLVSIRVIFLADLIFNEIFVVIMENVDIEVVFFEFVPGLPGEVGYGGLPDQGVLLDGLSSRPGAPLAAVR